MTTNLYVGKTLVAVAESESLLESSEDIYDVLGDARWVDVSPLWAVMDKWGLGDAPSGDVGEWMDDLAARKHEAVKHLTVEVATYAVTDTASGYAVRRQDGHYAEFLGSVEAKHAAELLNAGEASESDYEWQVA